MNGNDIAKILTSKLIELGFIVHRYNSHSTSSIYLKLDYGISCGIRIADHEGRKKYHYRFNLLKDYKGDGIIYRDNLISYFFNYNELDKVINAVIQEREKKLKKYGIDNYKLYMEEESKTDLYTRFSKVKGEQNK